MPSETTHERQGEEGFECIGHVRSVRFLNSRIMKLPLLITSLLVAGPLWSLPDRSNASTGQTTSCDSLLEQPASNPNGYRLRGDRCEGIFVQQVAGTPLLVASFTASFDQYDVSNVQSLDIGWSVPVEGPIQLRAYGLRRKLYYRMDTMVSSARRSYTWPADLLAALNIPQPEVGVVGWIRNRVGRIDRDVYLPLQIGARRSRPDNYMLVLLPGVPLSEIYVSLAAVGSDGRAVKYIRDEEPLKYNYYPAERAIDIPITRLPTPGIYYALIGAEMQSGGSLTTELWFYHPPQ